MAIRALGPASLSVAQAVRVLPASAWLVGCSGGPDSLALAWAAAQVARSRDTPVRALVIDHGLQGESDRTAAAVAAQLAARGIPAEVRRVSVDRTGRGVEAAARDARYAAFGEVRRPDECVLLGHTLDDQAETVLLGIARGSGLRSLAGMAPERGPYRRPLLGLRRATTQAACTEQGLTPWFDPHNQDTSFARVRVRSQVLPVLEEALGPGIAESLARTARLAQADADLLEGLAGEGGDDPHCGYLHGLDPALRARKLHRWILACGGSDLSATHLSAVERLITAWHGQRGVDVPGGRVLRMDGRLKWRSSSG
ncbi:MAG: tRNA lysidine(34) synthetase TilS [Propioniciclava sp.]